MCIIESRGWWNGTFFFPSLLSPSTILLTRMGSSEPKDSACILGKFGDFSGRGVCLHYSSANHSKQLCGYSCAAWSNASYQSWAFNKFFKSLLGAWRVLSLLICPNGLCFSCLDNTKACAF